MLKALSARLTGEFGRGFFVSNRPALIPGGPVSMRPGEFRLLPGDNLLQFDCDVPAKEFTALSPIHLTYNVVMDLVELSEE